MNIGIIGAGALGMLFASKLKLAGHKVKLWCRTEYQAKQIRQQGIDYMQMLSEQGTTRLHFDAVNVFNRDHIELVNKEQVDFTIVTIKQHAFNDEFNLLLREYQALNKDNLFVFIQNGMGHIDKVRAFIDETHTIQAVTSEAALRIDSGVVHTGHGTTYLESNPFIEQSTKLVEECLNKAGIQCLVSNSINEHVFKKLIINAVINPLTALYKVKNGQLPMHPARLQLMQLLFDETKCLLEKVGSLPLHISFHDVLSVCEKTAQNQSSMLADVLHGRMTEIEAINGAIVKLASQHHVQAPINETVYLLLLAQHPLMEG